MMKYRRSISLLSISLIFLSVIASLFGILTRRGPGEHKIESFRGGDVFVYGKGLYENEPVSNAVQVIAQDMVTILLGIPLLLFSLILFRRGSLRGQFILAGTLGYFLYTYASYTFLLMYNHFFLIYVLLMSISFFAFILVMMSFDIKNLGTFFTPKIPAKWIGGVLILMGSGVLLMWMGRILPSMKNGTVPEGLEHSTTLVIQALDLGFIVPIAILAGILTIRRKPFGYLLASIVIVKLFTLSTAVTFMAFSMKMVGLEVSLVESLSFSVITLIFIFLMCLIINHVEENPHTIITDILDDESLFQKGE